MFVLYEYNFVFIDEWTSRWVQSEHKSDLGKFELSAGSFYGDAEKDKGIKTSQDAKFYGLSAKHEKVFHSFESISMPSQIFEIIII